jgi:hypothetical protein
LAVLDVLEVRRDLTGRERVEWTEAVRRLVAGAAELHLRRLGPVEAPEPTAKTEPKPQPTPQPTPQQKTRKPAPKKTKKTRKKPSKPKATEPSGG